MVLTIRRDCRSLRRGKHRLYLWPGREADGANETITPSKTGTRDEMGRLEKVLDGYISHASDGLIRQHFSL